MRVLVTGSLGAIGSHLVPELESRGYTVLGCDLQHSSQERYVRCDVAEYRQVRAITEGAQARVIYHLAAEFGRWNGERYFEQMWRTNAIGTRNVLEMAHRMHSKVVIFSSSEIYGDYEGIMHEWVPNEVPMRHMNDYAASKWVNEIQALNSDVETVRVRLFNTYGPGETYHPYRSAICRFIYHALKGLPYTVYTDHERTSTYVTDTVKTLANIADNFTPGEVYNIGGRELHTMKEVSDQILEYLGLTDANVTYQKSEPRTTRIKRVDVAKAERDLGHDPKVSLAEGIPETIEWMRGTM